MRSTLSVLLILLVTDVSSAGLFRFHSKGCSDGCPTLACEPVIARPSCTTIFNHQRRISATKCCSEESCGPASCCAPVACLGGDCSAPQLFCTSEASCCAPNASCCPEPTCAAAAGCCTDSGCCADLGCGSGDGCGSGAACYSNEDCKVIAHLIYESMTGCYASIRRKAIHRLGDHFDCVCHPEIMTAFVHALNDSDESVREMAADEIGDQIRRNRVCVGQPVIEALQCALADCDRAVRSQSEQALRLAGYRIVDGACCSISHTPQVMAPMAPPQIHPEVLNEAGASSQQLLPQESEFTTEHQSNASLKVHPVSSHLASRLKPIRDSILRKQDVETFNAAIPPPLPPQEPADPVPAIPEEADSQNSTSRRGLMSRLFGELRD